MPVSEPFLTYLPGSPVKKPSALSLFKEKHSIPRDSFIHLSKSLVDEPTSRFPNRAPMERDARLQSPFYLSFRVRSKGALSRSPSENSHKERRSTSRTPFNHPS